MVALGLNLALPVVYLLSIIVGLACAVKSSFYPIAINLYASTKQTAMFQSVYICVMYLASAICAYVPNVMMALFGGGYQRAIMLTGIALMIVAIAFMIFIKAYIDKNNLSKASN